jgi:hypothetical protein
MIDRIKTTRELISLITTKRQFNKEQLKEINHLIELVLYSPNPEIFKHDLEKYIKIDYKGVLK